MSSSHPRSSDALNEGSCSVAANCSQGNPTSGGNTVSSSTPHLYKHALESVFGFLSLGELATALRVCHLWLAAVKSMRLINGSLDKENVDVGSMCSPLARHVSRLESNDLDATTLMLLALHLTNLRELHCALEYPSSQDEIIFPSKLESLKLLSSRFVEDSVEINRMLVAVSQLQFLQSFHLELQKADTIIDFTPLQQLSRLAKFGFSWDDMDDIDQTPTDAQVDQIHNLPHLTDLSLMQPTSKLLCRLIRQPHSLQWKSIGDDTAVNAKLASLLPSLPSLTRLDIRLISADCDLSFLSQLPNLTKLSIYIEHSIIDQIMTVLQGCVHLMDLTLVGFTAAAHMTALLPHLTQLQKLTLRRGRLDSLVFLSQGSIIHTLTHLRLIDCNHSNLHITELKHVNALQSLTHLEINRSFAEPMDEATQLMYEPPSKLFPKLVNFEYASSV